MVFKNSDDVFYVIRPIFPNFIPGRNIFFHPRASSRPPPPRIVRLGFRIPYLFMQLTEWLELVQVVPEFFFRYPVLI